MKNETEQKPLLDLEYSVPIGTRTLFVLVDTIDFWHQFNLHKKWMLDKAECLFPDTIFNDELLQYKSKDVIDFLTNCEQEFIADQYVFNDKYPNKELFESPLLKIGRIIFFPKIGANQYDSTLIKSCIARSLDIDVSYSNTHLKLDTTENLIYKILNIAMYFNYKN